MDMIGDIDEVEDTIGTSKARQMVLSKRNLVR